MGRSLTLRVYRLQLVAHFGLAFATAARLRRLTLLQTSNSPDHYAKGTPSAACGASSALSLRPLVSAWFQVLLTRLVAVLFIVQSPYLFTIGHRGVFSLGRWAALLRTRFHESRATLVRLVKTGPYPCRLRDYHPLWSAFPEPFD